MESMHVNDNIDLDNAVGLNSKELAERKVEYLDIRAAANDPNVKAADASKFKSAKTGRGPLSEKWERSGTKPMMCCYKVVRAQLKVFGLQTAGENAILNQQRGIFTGTLCKAFVTIDDWFNVTMEEIRTLEEDVATKSEALKASKAAEAK